MMNHGSLNILNLWLQKLFILYYTQTPKLSDSPMPFIQGSHTSEISKFPTISQLFRSPSPTISQPKLHGSHDFRINILTFSIFFKMSELFPWLFSSPIHPFGLPITLHKFNKFPTYYRLGIAQMKFPTISQIPNPCGNPARMQFHCFPIYSNLTIFAEIKK